MELSEIQGLVSVFLKWLLTILEQFGTSVPLFLGACAVLATILIPLLFYMGSRNDMGPSWVVVVFYKKIIIFLIIFVLSLVSFILLEVFQLHTYIRYLFLSFPFVCVFHLICIVFDAVRTLLSPGIWSEKLVAYIKVSLERSERRREKIRDRENSMKSFFNEIASGRLKIEELLKRRNDITVSQTREMRDRMASIEDREKKNREINYNKQRDLHLKDYTFRIIVAVIGDLKQSIRNEDTHKFLMNLSLLRETLPILFMKDCGNVSYWYGLRGEMEGSRFFIYREMIQVSDILFSAKNDFFIKSMKDFYSDMISSFILGCKGKEYDTDEKLLGFNFLISLMLHPIIELARGNNVYSEAYEKDQDLYYFHFKFFNSRYKNIYGYSIFYRIGDLVLKGEIDKRFFDILLNKFLQKVVPLIGSERTNKNNGCITKELINSLEFLGVHFSKEHPYEGGGIKESILDSLFIMLVNVASDEEEGIIQTLCRIIISNLLNEKDTSPFLREPTFKLDSAGLTELFGIYFRFLRPEDLFEKFKSGLLWEGQDEIEGFFGVFFPSEKEKPDLAFLLLLGYASTQDYTPLLHSGSKIQKEIHKKCQQITRQINASTFVSRLSQDGALVKGVSEKIDDSSSQKQFYAMIKGIFDYAVKNKYMHEAGLLARSPIDRSNKTKEIAERFENGMKNREDERVWSVFGIGTGSSIQETCPEPWTIRFGLADDKLAYVSDSVSKEIGTIFVNPGDEYFSHSLVCLERVKFNKVLIRDEKTEELPGNDDTEIKDQIKENISHMKEPCIVFTSGKALDESDEKIFPHNDCEYDIDKISIFQDFGRYFGYSVKDREIKRFIFVNGKEIEYHENYSVYKKSVGDYILIIDKKRLGKREFVKMQANTGKEEVVRIGKEIFHLSFDSPGENKELLEKILSESRVGDWLHKRSNETGVCKETILRALSYITIHYNTNYNPKGSVGYKIKM